MKKILTIIFLFYSLQNFAQVQPNWIWTKSANGGLANEATDIAIDKNNNTYITGWFTYPKIIFGNDTLSEKYNLNTSYLVKYDDNGNILWAKSFKQDSASNSFNLGWTISTDKDDNIYLGGVYQGSDVVIDNDTLKYDTTTNGQEMFIVKFNENGKKIWTKKVEGTFSGGFQFATNNLNETYVYGNFFSVTAKFDLHTLYQTSPIGYTADIFIAKLDSNGKIIWAKSFIDSLYWLNGYTPLIIDSFNNFYISGNTQTRQINFGNGVILNKSNSFFLTKFDSSGKALWVRTSDSVSSSGVTSAMAASTDRFGNVYVTGVYRQFMKIDTFILSDSGFAFNTFYSKYDVNGNLKWVKSINGSQGQAIASNKNGDIFIAAAFDMYPNNHPHYANFSGYHLNYPIVDTLFDPLFVAKFDTNGKLICADALASGGDDLFAMVTNSTGDAIVTGDYINNPMKIGNDSLHYDTTGSRGQYGEQIFIAKFQCGEDVGIQKFPTKTNLNFFTTYLNSNTLNIRWNELKEGNASIQLYDVLGRKVFEKNVSATENFCHTEIPNLPSALYFVQVKQKEKSHSDKVLWVE